MALSHKEIADSVRYVSDWIFPAQQLQLSQKDKHQLGVSENWKNGPRSLALWIWRGTTGECACSAASPWSCISKGPSGSQGTNLGWGGSVGRTAVFLSWRGRVIVSPAFPKPTARVWVTFKKHLRNTVPSAGERLTCVEHTVGDWLLIWSPH